MDSPAARFGDLTLGAFVDRLASAAPTPGGGAASAVAAALAAGLVSMVASLSVDRPKYAAYAEHHAAATAAGHELAARLLSLADEDAAAYDAFGMAMKMPRETDDEKAARTARIREAARAAADVPLRILAACREIVLASERLAGRSNLNAASDLAVASRLAEAAAHGAAENVRVNLPLVGDEAFASGTEGRVSSLLCEIEELAETTRAHVELAELREP
jgi:formiminotetrahydrofolate cyclodeaminase